MFKFLRRFRFLVFALVLLTTTSAAAKPKGDQPCGQMVVVTFDPADTLTAQCDDVRDFSTVTNTTLATCAGSSITGSFSLPVPVQFNSLRAWVGTAPGASDYRTFAVGWIPPGGAATMSTTTKCSIIGTQTSCTSPGNELDEQIIPVGSAFFVRMDTQSSPTAPDAATEASVAFCMSPSRQP